jgi:hypothetical protein
MTTVLQPLEAEVEAPRLVRPRELRSHNFGNDEPFATAISEREALGFPDAMHRFEVHPFQQSVNPSKAVARIRFRDLNDPLPDLWAALLWRGSTGEAGQTRHAATASSRIASSKQKYRRSAPAGEAHHFPRWSSL